MAKSVALGVHFEKFVADQVAHGRYNNESEVVRAGLRLLEEHELKLRELRALIHEGDRALENGRFTAFERPYELAADINSRGRLRSTGKSKRT